MLRTWLERVVGRGGQAGQRGRARLAVENENTFLVGTSRLDTAYDRADYDREEVLERALSAWRSDPLARRIVELTTQYVTGGRAGSPLRSGSGAGTGFLARVVGAPAQPHRPARRGVVR